MTLGLVADHDIRDVPVAATRVLEQHLGIAVVAIDDSFRMPHTRHLVLVVLVVHRVPERVGHAG